MKPSIPKGTRDFTPVEALKRKYLFSVIEEVFRRYGYAPIETPSMENLETLTGKYGEEGERLLFKVLNNGDFLSKADEEALRNRDSAALVPSIARRGMRYDLTVPFARFVVMHRHQIQLPFKRYQMQPVWRADRPQKGRYQEFYQCDVDVVGSTSLICEAELVQIYDEVFSRLKLPVVIRLNHRKILSGIAGICGIGDKLTDMTVAIDKFDKVGADGVREELQRRGISADQAQRVLRILKVESLGDLKSSISESGVAMEGYRDMAAVFRYLEGSQLANRCRYDVRLARGLDYYTGCILEVDALDADIGSLGGGGRYDDLTGVFGMPGLPGVGVSFGAERIYDTLENMDGFPEDLQLVPRVLFVAFDETALAYAFRMLSQVRKAGIPADVYPDPVKIQKQMKYADAIGVPHVVIVGEEEMQKELLTVRNMKSGNQQQVSLPGLIALLQQSA